MSESQFVSPYQLKTPVLFLVFNRPDTTKQVFETIRKAKPPKLYVAADGPRKNNETDIQNIKQVKAIVMNVDWSCELKTLFRDENLGCEAAVSSAIDWFFSNEEKGIILEDDCLPEQSFFLFCQELLEYYRDDKRVMMISGTNYLFNKIEIEESYFFSKYFAIWGWATWRRAWKLYDSKMSEWNKYRKLKYLDWIYSKSNIINYLQSMIQSTYDHELDTWDVKWVYSCIFESGLSIVPKYNLISNIGVQGTHTDGEVSKFNFMPVKPINTSVLIHPQNVVQNVYLDKIAFNTITNTSVSKISRLRKITGI